MSDIKFRQYIKRKNRMQYGIGIFSDGSWCGPENVTLSQDPLMQYIGIKDIKGKEIYEGDILKSSFKKSIAQTEYFALVKYGDYQCCNEDCFCGVDYDECFGIYLAIEQDQCPPGPWISKYEIIGNVYENPELLDKIGA